jgi:hypothetical protein
VLNPCRSVTTLATTSGPTSLSPEPQVLQGGEGDLAQDRVVVQAAPAPAFQVVEAEFLLHLLVHLLADPADLDGRGERPERHFGRVVGEVVLALAGGALLADQPRLVPGQVLGTRGDQTVGDPHPHGREARPERSFRSVPPGSGAEGTGCLAVRPVDRRCAGTSVTSAGKTFRVGPMPSAQASARYSGLH